MSKNTILNTIHIDTQNTIMQTFVYIFIFFILGWVRGEGPDMYNLSIYYYTILACHYIIRKNTTSSFTIACTVIVSKKKKRT